MVLNYLHPRSACFYFLIILFTSQGPRRVLRPSSSFLLYFLLLHRAWERVLRPFFMILFFIFLFFSTSQGLRHVLSQALFYYSFYSQGSRHILGPLFKP